MEIWTHIFAGVTGVIVGLVILSPFIYKLYLDLKALENKHSKLFQHMGRISPALVIHKSPSLGDPGVMVYVVTHENNTGIFFTIQHDGSYFHVNPNYAHEFTTPEDARERLKALGYKNISGPFATVLRRPK